MERTIKAARAIAPGRIVARELEERGWSQKTLADIMGRPPQAINEIVNATKQITPETALELAAAFGTSAELWTNLETSYRLSLAAQQTGRSEIERRSRLHTLVPVNEIARRGWINATRSIDELEQEICRFLGIRSLDEQPQTALCFRHSIDRGPSAAGKLAWARRVEQLAVQQTVEPFDDKRLKSRLPELLSLAERPEDIARIPDTLHKMGVRFVVEEHLPKTFIDGAAFRIGNAPVIALTVRYDRIDSFWFSLLHELAHHAAGHKGNRIDSEDDPRDEVEKEADRMAGEWLLNESAYRQFVQHTQPYFSKEKIASFAETQKRHPGIVLGRLQREGLVPYANLRGLLVKIRSFLPNVYSGK